MGWFDERFIPSESRLRFDCEHCSKGMWFPKCKHGKYKTCSPECANAMRDAARSSRIRPCENCGADFAPRLTQTRAGHGRFCSQVCNVSARDALLSPESKLKAKAVVAAMREAGLIKQPRGEESASWKGGIEAFKERNARKIAEYKRKNKDKVAAWSANRRKRGAGKLPSTTVADLMRLQKGKCAVCHVQLSKAGVHLDHVFPLAKGGRNERENVQLLCPTCNTKKAAKNPTDFMQEMGYLL